MTDKQTKKIFFTISEVEVITGIKQHVLRSWEKKIPSLQPLRHNGRRLYNHDTLSTLKKIKDMTSKQGYKLAAVESVMRHKPRNTTNNEQPQAAQAIKHAIENLQELKKDVSLLLSKVSS